ncbi:type ISP restriction/modification enzyme [Flavobacterium sp. j3]|uniref:site-specific DNA-methyltransferase (adenine-specific) n=1 Tax=Flavobacterium aureirubrum TaxID=3133147 RepID=A0ABU9N7H9_9FLAO
MTLAQYIAKIDTLYKTGNAREHSYRGDLQNLIMAILPDVLVTNEPARVDCGAPDYVLTRKDVPIGYIEAKDIGVDLASKTLKEQFDRYKAGLTNLIFTDYLDFHFYKEGEFITKIAIAKIENNAIIPIPENFNQFESLIINFAQTISQTIKSPTKLAQMMAGKAKLMADVIEKSLNKDDENQNRSQLKSQMLSFQQMLIHDIDNKAFADIYAQTIAYGMFAARYHDPTLPTFSREEAASLIPKSNPFLRKLFQDIAGYDLDNRLVWIVEELVSIFLASDVAMIMKNFGRSTKQEDPVVHFYETFLGEYNPALRKARGVWYTPQPVVNFIVRAVDDILKTEFNLKEGLADTSKIKIKKKAVTQTKGKDAKLKEVETEIEVHKVQILDPATGTGTFLAEVVKHIHKKFEGQQGIWSKYVTNDLIPRLNGFELLMASYAMAHLKMDMLLTETGYKPTDDQRFRIFLTNSLEEAHPDTQTLFSSWLSDEADQANAIKRDAPVMVVIGNPPYSGISSNNGKWISDLIEDYKYVDGEHFKERKHWLNDDYVKFMRFGQHFIDKNGSGILAFINPHGFLDNPTFRGMRWHLLQSFDKIYTIDLHGNSNKKETSPDGSTDQNVFDIQQGVSINLFVKTGNKKSEELANIFHSEIYGKREIKYKFLNDSNLKSIKFKEIKPEKPYLFFINSDNILFEIYTKGFQVNKLFVKNSVGFVSANDGLNISFSKEEQINKIKDLILMDENLWRIKYNRLKDARDWTYKTAKNDGLNFVNSDNYIETLYRPFDKRFTLYTGNSRGLYSSPQPKIMQQFIKNDNLGLVTARSNKSETCDHFFISKNIMETKCGERTTQSAIFPLYLYPETTTQTSLLNEVVRTPNLNMEIVNKMATDLGMYFAPEKPDTKDSFVISTQEKSHNANPTECDDTSTQQNNNNAFAPIDILDYIYAVLHSPSYREKYKEFLKIDFPRVPYPKNLQGFKNLVGLGAQLRQIHLLESEAVDKLITQYPEDGDNVVTKPKFVAVTSSAEQSGAYREAGNVFINETQYFANVPLVAWNFYIGGYQPAQKWLKDRKDRELSYEDIRHYQKIIVALTETDRLMKEIDTIEL